MTDTATRLAGLSTEHLTSLHDRLDRQGAADAAVVEVHHLATMELLKRGIPHTHEADEWSEAVVLVETMTVDSIDDIEAPEGFEKALSESLIGGGTLSVLLTVDGYVLKADPTVSDVHVDAVMGSGRRRKPKAEIFDLQKTIKEEGGKFTVYSEDGGRKFGTYATRDEAEARLRQIERFAKAEGYSVPSGVQEAARRAVGWIKDGKAGDGFTSVGRNRASQLASGGVIGRATLVKMRAYFARHGKQRGDHDALVDGEPTPWRVAWDAWGGDAGRAWVNRVLGAVEKRAIPEPITDLHLNLENRQHAIDEYLYGPMNPDDPGDYWDRLGEVWDVSGDEASSTRCGNCAAFNVKSDIRDAIGEAISEEGEEVVDLADLGYCELLQFKCAGSRSCSVWMAGGPISDDFEGSDDEIELLESMDAEDFAEFASYAYLADEMDDVEKRGNPEALRDYWRGGGKGKISWGAGGDFTACVAAVGKYMTSEQAKGYCAIRHREVTGMWPGDKRNRTKKSVEVASAVPSTATVEFPGGVTYTLNFGLSEPVLKHPGHADQKVHAGGRGSGLDRGVADSIIERTRANGGLSVSMVDGSEPPGGFMVARTSGVKPAIVEADEFYDPERGPQALGSFLKANKDQLTGGDYLGVWHDSDSGKVFLDVSQNVKDRGTAERLGRERDQISIWDVTNMKEISTGGTGEIAKADSGDQVAGSVDDDGRGDRRLRGADLAAVQPEVAKHLPGQHDQAAHAKGGAGSKRSTPKGGVGTPGTTIDSYPEPVRRAIRRKPRTVEYNGGTIVKGRDSVWDHLVPDGEGGYRLTPERAAIHEEIITSKIKGKPSQDNPEMIIMGGGGGAGKGTLIDSGKIRDMPDKDTRVHIDADEIKMEIPDYGRFVDEGRKTEVAGWTHEESSMIGKEVQRRAIAQRSHILLDGTGDSSEDSLRKKIEGPRAAGYKVRGEYVTAPTLQAWEQNVGRASRGARGLVPPGALVEAHKSVSRIVPKMATEFDEFQLWDSSGGRGNQVVVASATRGGTLRVRDRARYRTFLDKADEPISTDQLLADITPAQWTAIREAR